MTCGNPSHIRKWFGPCHLSYGHGGSCEHPPLASLYESDGRCDKCGNDREAWDRAIAEIARLTAELAAAREVPADVEAAIAKHDEWLISNALMGVDARLIGYLAPLRAAIARAIAAARSEAPATVGGLLATAPVDLAEPTGSQWTHAIEWLDGGTWFRIAPGKSADGSPSLILSTWSNGRWHYEDENPMSIDACVYARPARLVPTDEAEADRDPATRGPLPGGEG